MAFPVMGNLRKRGSTTEGGVAGGQRYQTKTRVRVGLAARFVEMSIYIYVVYLDLTTTNTLGSFIVILGTLAPPSCIFRYASAWSKKNHQIALTLSRKCYYLGTFQLSAKR